MYATPGWNQYNPVSTSLGRSMGVPTESQGAFSSSILGIQSGVMHGPVYGYPGLASPTRPAAFTEGKLFLGGLNSSTTKESLLDYCKKWSDGGEITDAVVMDGRGFGFITFLDPKNAQKFLEQRSHTIDGKSVEAKAAVPKGVGSGSNLTKKLFVGGTGELSDEDFRCYFDSYGDIQDAVIVRKQDGTSRGFGFVTFTNEMAVEKCLVMQHEIKGRKVDLRRAVPREQMASSQAVCLSTNRPPSFGGIGFNSCYNGMGYPDLSMLGYNMGTNYPVGMMPAPFANYVPY
eukprot:g1531.t1